MGMRTIHLRREDHEEGCSTLFKAPMLLTFCSIQIPSTKDKAIISKERAHNSESCFALKPQMYSSFKYESFTESFATSFCTLYVMRPSQFSQLRQIVRNDWNVAKLAFCSKTPRIETIYLSLSSKMSLRYLWKHEQTHYSESSGYP